MIGTRSGRKEWGWWSMTPQLYLRPRWSSPVVFRSDTHGQVHSLPYTLPEFETAFRRSGITDPTSYHVP